MERDNPVRSPNHQTGFSSDTHVTVLGAIYALRAFQYDDDAGVLTGLTYPQAWTPGVNHAQCFNERRLPPEEQMRTRFVSYGGWPMPPRTERRPIEPGPQDRSHDMKRCSCGFWAYHDVTKAGSYVTTSRIAGIVALSGRCVPGEAGWRAVNAQIVALITPWKGVIDPLSWRELLIRYGATEFGDIGSAIKAHTLTPPDPWMLPLNPDGRRA